MGVHRPPLPADSYVIVPRDWMRDEHLSWRAKGLLAYLCTHADGYRISQSQMLRQATDGRDALLSGLRELEAAGYLTRNADLAPGTDRAREGGRYIEDDYTITDPAASPGNPRESAGKLAGRPTSAGKPRRSSHGGGPEGKKIKREDQRSAPSEQATQLSLVAGGDADGEESTPGQRALALARTYHEAVSGMAPFMGVRNVCALAIKAGKWSDEEIAAGLKVIADRGTTLTANVLRAVLAGQPPPRGTASNGHAYRNPPAGSYAAQLDRPF